MQLIKEIKNNTQKVKEKYWKAWNVHLLYNYIMLFNLPINYI
jgi:hypothetical protein